MAGKVRRDSSAAPAPSMLRHGGTGGSPTASRHGGGPRERRVRPRPSGLVALKCIHSRTRCCFHTCARSSRARARGVLEKLKVGRAGSEPLGDVGRLVARARWSMPSLDVFCRRRIGSTRSGWIIFHFCKHFRKTSTCVVCLVSRALERKAAARPRGRRGGDRAL